MVEKSPKSKKKLSSAKPKKAAKPQAEQVPTVKEETMQTNSVVEPAKVTPVAQPESDEATLKITVSRSFASKLKRTAQEEGLSLDDLATELLTEGLVIRSWEIVERKLTMRGETGNQNNNQNRGNNNFRRNNHHKHGGQGGKRPGFNNNVLDDRASFIDYVRNQNPNRR